MVRTALTTTLLLASALVLAPGCAKPELGNPADWEVTLGEDDLFTEPADQNDGVGLHAKAQGQNLVISLRNNRRSPVTIYPVNFLLITGPNRESDIHPVSPVTATLRAVPPVILGPGQRGVMTIPMRLTFPLSGTRLALYNPDLDIKVRTDVQ